MAIVRVSKQENPFVQIDKYGINDERLSWKAKGLLVYLLSKPDDWKVWIKDLVKRAKDGEKAVYSGLEELERNGYISRRQFRKEDGTFGSMEYVVHERPIEPQLQNGDTVETQENQGLSPQPQKGDADKKEPYPQNRHAENPHAENRHYTNNELTNNDLNKKDDDEYIKNQNFFIREFVEEAKERNIPNEEIYEVVTQLQGVRYQIQALDNTLDKVLPKYAAGEVSKFSSYFISVLTREQRRLEYVNAQPKQDHQSKENFPFYNWLENDK